MRRGFLEALRYGCYFMEGGWTWLGLGRDSDSGDIDRTGGKKKKKKNIRAKGPVCLQPVYVRV